MPDLSEYVFKVTQLLSETNNKHYAVILNDDKVLCAGTHTGQASATFQTALVNALQNNYAKLSYGNCWAICTYPPTEMCLGMAHILGLHFIWYETAQKEGVLAETKKGYDQNAFYGKAPKMSADSLIDKSKFSGWNKTAARALGQAADVGIFTQAALDVLSAVSKAITSANTERADIPADIAGALDKAPISAAPGSGTFNYADWTFTHLVFAMIGQTWNPTIQACGAQNEGEKHMGNNIAAVLLDENFQIVAWGLNFAAKNPTFHAETFMLQWYLKKNNKTQLPANYTIYTSLQPCDMCGSFILHVANKTKVVYARRDFGLTTTLTKNGTDATAKESLSTQVSKEVTDALEKKIKGGFKGNSAQLLRDQEDVERRLAQIELCSSYLTADERKDYNQFKTAKQRGKFLGQKDFFWLKKVEDRLNTIPMLKAEIASKSPLHVTGHLGNLPLMNGNKVAYEAKERLGFEFVKSCDVIASWAQQAVSAKEDPQTIKLVNACKQGMEVLEQLVCLGLNTAYGIKMINYVIEKQEAAAKAAIARVASSPSAAVAVVAKV